ncbi:protein turtle homolog A isoform X2 [Ischnura elegans]|uniref:protein turtle homolog A isoform X2 n=1 Tax=Ischnura elegans TaxID=197161 RepID=UPI001ED877D6|nr:protein turtle homolog A isoform X2 [Ischnura elegans]
MIIKKIVGISLLLVLVKGFCHASDTEYPEIQEEAVDIGKNLVLRCTGPDSPLGAHSTVMWVREGRKEKLNQNRVQEDGSLSLVSLKREDAGVYACSVEGENGGNHEDVIKARVRVEVRTPPPALVNVTVHPSTVLALLLWDVAEDGGYPISHFTARYRLAHQSNTQPNVSPNQEWHFVVPDHISANVRQIDVYRLQPNSTYIFQIWASNSLGPGNVTEMETKTLNDVEEIELARHLLEGAEEFDTRVWVAAVAVVMGTLLMLAVGTCYLLYKECQTPNLQSEDQEVIELLPNIILNPGFDSDAERIEPDENSNDQTASVLNNNTLVHPARV